MQGTIGFIGAGAMAEAMISGMLGTGLVSSGQIMASDPSPGRLQLLHDRYGIVTTAANDQVVTESSTVVLAVKPQILREVVEALCGTWRQEQLVISIAAGITLTDLEAWLPPGTPVIRTVPNTPCLVGEGATVLSMGSAAVEHHRVLAETIFGAVGIALTMPEQYLDAVTGLSGSGPAYIYLVIEALADAGVRVGLPRDVGLMLAVQTVVGAAKMVKNTGGHPAQLKDMVTSPGGTTIAGLHVLERGGLRGLLMDAVMTARDRAVELRGKT